MTTQQTAIRGTRLILIASALWLGVLGGGQAIAGVQTQVSKTSSWGVAAEYAYGGTLDMGQQSASPVPTGGRGNLVGSYPDTGIFFSPPISAGCSDRRRTKEDDKTGSNMGPKSNIHTGSHKGINRTHEMGWGPER